MYQLPPVTSRGGGCSPRRIFQRDWTKKKHTDCRKTKCCEYIDQVKGSKDIERTTQWADKSGLTMTFEHVT